jgi:hypothetical protein
MLKMKLFTMILWEKKILDKIKKYNKNVEILKSPKNNMIQKFKKYINLEENH